MYENTLQQLKCSLLLRLTHIFINEVIIYVYIFASFISIEGGKDLLLQRFKLELRELLGLFLSRIYGPIKSCLPASFSLYLFCCSLRMGSHSPVFVESISLQRKGIL